MFRSKITVFGIFTVIYSFRLNITWDTNIAQDTQCHMGKSVIPFCWDQIDFITKTCLLD